MKEHNKTYYSLEELKRARDCYEGYQDGEEVYYFVGALRYACDEIERLNNIINELDKETYLGTIENQNNNDYSKGLYTAYKYTNDRIKELKGVDKE